MSATVLLGNTAPNRLAEDANGQVVPTRATDIGNTVTVFALREDALDDGAVRRATSTDNDPALNVIVDALGPNRKQYALAVLEVNDAWSAAHSDDPPEWVASDEPGLARALAHWFSAASHERVDIRGVVAAAGRAPALLQTLRTWFAAGDHVCGVGRPDGWTAGVANFEDLLAIHGPTALSLYTGQPPVGGGADDWQPDAFSDDFRARWRTHELLTNAGRDALHLQHYGGATAGAQPAQFGYMAVSANAAAESAANTTLPGEITTAGGGLVRKQATYAHTVGTATTTLTATFTANGTDALPVTLAKDGIFNAASAGTFGYEKLLNATATITVAGDNAAITHTMTAQ